MKWGRALRRSARCARSSESAAPGKRRCVARAMKHANDHHRIGPHNVVNGVGAVELHAKAGSKLLARGTRQREVTQRRETRLDRIDKARRNPLRSLGSKRRPDFSEVFLSSVG